MSVGKNVLGFLNFYLPSATFSLFFFLLSMPDTCIDIHHHYYYFSLHIIIIQVITINTMGIMHRVKSGRRGVWKSTSWLRPVPLQLSDPHSLSLSPFSLDVRIFQVIQCINKREIDRGLPHQNIGGKFYNEVTRLCRLDNIISSR